MSEESSDSGTENIETVYTCKKCPNQEFRTTETMEAHRAWHRNRRTKDVKSKGPKKGTKKPRSSPAPSSTTLFSVRVRSPPKRNRIEPDRYAAPDSPRKKDTSAVARRKRSHKKHLLDGLTTTTTNGG